MAQRIYPLFYVGESSREMVEVRGARLARLVREGFDVHVIAADDGGMEALAELGVTTRPIPAGGWLNPAGWLGAYFILQAYVLEHRPVLVHGFGAPWAWLAAFAARQAETEVVIATVEHHSFEPADWGGTAALARPLRALLATIDAWTGGVVQHTSGRIYGLLAELVDRYVVTNEVDLAALEERGLVAGAKLELAVGGRGVDLERFDPEHEDMPFVGGARQALGVPEQWRNVAGLVIERAAMIEEVVELIEASRRAVPSLGWVIVAGPEIRDRRRLRRLVEAGAARIVDEATPGYYRALDLLVWPDLADATGRRPMEAAAMGVPTVGYATAAGRAAVADLESGRLATVGDRAALLERLVEVVRDPKRMGDYGIRARSRAEARLDRRQIDTQMLRLYDRTLGSRL